MGLIIRSLRIFVPLFVGTLILTGLYFFGSIYQFELKSVPAPNNSSVSVSVDGDGAVHFAHSVSYEMYNSDQGLYTTSNESGKWHTVRVSDNMSVDSVSILSDHDSHSHIAYTYDLDLSTAAPPDTVEGYVGYATDTSGAWQTFVVANGTPLYRPCQLALTAEGLPGILYNDNGNLMLACASSGPGISFTRESTGAAALSGSLAFTPDGVPHVSYVWNEALKLATRLSPGVWESTTVVASGVSNHFTSVSSNANGSIGIAYFADNGGKGLWYAIHTTAGWYSTRVSNITGSNPSFCSLLLGDDGIPRISSSFGDTMAMYSVWTDAGWLNRQLAGGDSMPVDLAVSRDGTAYVTLGDALNRIDYMTDGGSATDVASSIPYLFPLGVALIAIAVLFMALELVRYLKKARDRDRRSDEGGFRAGPL